eukprot:m.251575 g.251575  ORF g.251575 m.251575 type:complete len:91 (-) comp10975_c0_seq25:274-546(-)
MTPLDRAVEHGHKDMAELLIARGADVHFKNDDEHGIQRHQPIHSAASAGQDAMVELLFAHGADVHDKGRNGDIPLHCAARSGCSSTVELL